MRARHGGEPLANAGCGPRAPQGGLFSLVAMKAGCLRTFEALRCGDGVAVPPAPPAVLPGVGAVLAPLSLVAFVHVMLMI